MNAAPDEELLFFPTRTAGRAGYTERIHAMFSQYLARHGLRLTGPRRRILDILLKAERHMSVSEIYLALKKHGVGRATVFRTLNMLEECKLASRVTDAGDTNRFEVGLERPHHDHLVCLGCGRIREVRWPRLEKMQQEACRKLGFEPDWHRHEIFGRCAGCRAKR